MSDVRVRFRADEENEQLPARMRFIESVLSKVLERAKELEISAGYAGSMGDNGASLLRSQVHFFRQGLVGSLPEEWKDYVQAVKNEADPEWSDYQRLKNKFEQQ